VTDGDTIVLRGIDPGEVHRHSGGRKARLIGVDTPEVFGGSECFGRAASSFTRAELDGARVRVDFDVGRTDRYGRALVYVWDDRGRFFNGRLVQEGYALQLTVVPNVRYAALFTMLAREARLAKRGLWDEC
jgi:micrococcal nuclease